MITIPLLNDLSTFLQSRKFDSAFEHLHFGSTVQLLTIFAMFSTARQYFGRPIQCTTAGSSFIEWQQNSQDFADTFCFINNTRFIQNDLKKGSRFPSDDHGINIAYYEWVPFYFLASAFMFYAPVMVFDILSTHQCNLNL